MALIHFWGKPGCQTNALQCERLRAEGHQVVEHDLLGEQWSAMRLLDFFMDLPVTEWFNMNAPRIKSGEIIPGMCDTTSALREMMKEPLLIRRPLMEIGDRRLVGFDPLQLKQATGSAIDIREACSGSLQQCTPAGSHH